MAVDINNELKKASQKTNVYKTYKQYKQSYDELKKKAGDSQETSNKFLSNQLSNFVDWRKKHTANPKTFLDELITQLKELKGAGLETDTLIKRIFVNSLKKIKPEIKQLVIDETKKSLACSGVQGYQFNTTYYIPVKSVDLFGIFELSTNDRIGKLFYEEKPVQYNTFPFSMNRELYERTQNLNQTYSSVSGNNYLGVSQQNLFDISYVESYIDPNTSQTIQGSFFKVDLKPRQNFPVIDEFLNDYFESVDILDYKTFFTNLVNYTTGVISFGRGDGNIKLTQIQKVLITMQRILGLCSDSNKEINVGGTSKVSEVDNVDESFYEFNDIDLRLIDQITSDIKLGVVEFEECENIKFPMNLEASLTALDNLQFFEDTSDVNEIDAALGIIYPVVDEDPTFKLSVDSGWFQQFVKAIMNTVISPKTVLPIMTVAGMLNQPIWNQIENIEDFLKKFKNFFNELLTKIAAIFTKAIFDELKKEIKALVALLLKDIADEKTKKKYQMILSIVAIIPALTQITKDFRECKSVLDELLQLLNIGVRKRLDALQNAGGDLPLPLLLSAKLLDGYSPTRSFLNTVQNLQQLGIPTGPMPDGSPNKFLASIKAMIDGNSQEIAENGKVAIGIGPLTITPAGITIPKDAYGKFI
jgi:hypothetical protein